MKGQEKKILENYIKTLKKGIKRLEREESVKRYKKLKKLINQATKYYFND